ncbi:MAG: hypothetical protein V8R49_10370 [Duodenibacillus massiliensis]
MTMILSKRTSPAHGPYVREDARSRRRFIGQNETMGPVAGHITGALNRP